MEVELERRVEGKTGDRLDECVDTAVDGVRPFTQEKVPIAEQFRDRVKIGDANRDDLVGRVAAGALLVQGFLHAVAYRGHEQVDSLEILYRAIPVQAQDGQSHG